MLVNFKLLLTLTIIFFGLLPTLVNAESNKGSGKKILTIITSFSREYTNEFRRHYENRHPETNIKFIKMKTGEAIKHLESTKDRNVADLFMASSPEVFEILKGKGLLQSYIPKPSGIPSEVSAFPINEKDSFYSGFALSGTGFMWNLRYLDAKSLPPPKKLEDLTQAVYQGHIAMSSPSRSSTTHIFVESILQNYGWYAGWAIIKKLSANVKTITKKSADVPSGVKDGKYGIGFVIDYYALTAKAQQYPVSFAYPENPHFLPANIGLIKNPQNKEGAIKFLNYLLSEEGQNILISRNIQRLPVLPSVYNNAPDTFPNPHTYKRTGDLNRNKNGYSLELSLQRYNLVNSLFENMITFNLEGLQQSAKTLQKLSVALKTAKNNPDVRPVNLLKARLLLENAQRHFVLMPIPEKSSQDKEYLSIFTEKRKKKSDPLPEEQKEIEMEWHVDIQEQYRRVQELADQGLDLLQGEQVSILDKYSFSHK